MGFSFAAFFFFVLITRTTQLDYDSKTLLPILLTVCQQVGIHLFIYSLLPVRLTVSAVVGVVGGVVLVMSWWRFGSVMACVVVVGLMLGFLVAATVLFTPLGTFRLSLCVTARPFLLVVGFFSRLVLIFKSARFRLNTGDLEVFRNSDVVFWVTFCCIMVTLPLLFVRWPREVTHFTLWLSDSTFIR